MNAHRSLRSSRDFRRVYAEGCSGRRDGVVVHVLRRGDENPTRLGLAVRMRRPSAVLRNRAKRRLRAAFRARAEERGYDVVVGGYPEVATVHFQELVDHLEAALERAGMRKAGK